MKALAYAFSAENPHALRNILLVAVTVAYLAVIVVLFLRLRHANQKMADRMKELNKQKQNRLPKKQKLLHRKNRLRANYILAVHAQKKHILIRKCRSIISAL